MILNENPVNKGKISPLFAALRDTLAEAQAEFQVTRNTEDTDGNPKDKDDDKENANDNEGFFLPFTPQTGTGKTYSCNQLIFVKLFDYVSERYLFLQKAHLVLQFITDNQIPEASQDASKAIVKLENAQIYSCGIDEKADREKLITAIQLIVKKAISNCHNKSLTDEINHKHNDFLKELQPTSISFQKIVFITNTRDNVSQSYNELLSMIETLCKTKLEVKLMKNMIVLVMSKADQTKAMGKSIKPLVEFIAEKSNSPSEAKSIRQKFDRFIHYHAKISDKSNVDKYDKEQFKTIAEEIYDSIYYGVRAIAALEDDAEKNLPTDIKKLLFTLYPASLISSGQAVVSFMTTSKYLGSIMAIPKRFHFTDDNLCNHILFIDEVDKQHAVVRDEILAADPMLLVRGVKTAAQSDVLHFQQGKDDFTGVSDIMSKAIDSLKDAANDWRTQYSYGFDQSYEGGSRAAELFSVPGCVSTIVTMSGKHERVEVIKDGVRVKKNAYYTVVLELADSDPTSENIKKNILKMKLVTDSNSETDEDFENGFPKVINSLSKAYKLFLNKSVKAVRKIYKNKKETYDNRIKQLKAQKAEFKENGKLNAKEQWVRVGREPSLLGCLNDFTYQLNIHDSVKNSIRSKLFGSHSGSGSLIGKEQTIICNGFHGYGCSFDTILQLSDNFVDFENYSIAHSGTGWIASLVAKGTQIIAISATAKNKSQIHNFSQTTLKATLGKRYVEFKKEQNLAVYQYYCQKRNYQAHGVDILSRFLQHDPNTLGQFFANSDVMLMKLAMAFPPPISKGSYEDNNKSSKARKETHKKDDYDHLMNIANQLSKMWQAIELFVAHPTNRYMLTFSTRNFGNTPKEQSFFKNYLVKFLEDKYGKKIDIYFAINAEKMRAGVLKKLLLKTMQKEGRINVKTIVMTSYASMAAGTNPDCYFHTDDEKRLVYVDDSDFKQKKKTMDADCIYLAKPTNMFNIAEDDDSNIISTKFKIACLYNLMCLYEGHFIDVHIARQFIRNVLSNNDKKSIKNMLAGAYASAESTKMSFDNAEDYLASVAMLIEQAIGRTGRTPWKSREIQIFADAALASLLAQDPRQKHELSHEYFALREEAKIVHSSGMVSAIKLASPEQKLRRAAIANNKKTLQYFNTEVPKLLGNYRYEMIQDADALNHLFNIISQISEPTYQNIEEAIEQAKQCALKNDVKIAQDSIWTDFKTTLHNMENHVTKGKANPVPPNIVVEKLKTKLQKEVKERKEQANEVANKWVELRDYVLKHPTISESEANPRFLYVHIEVPKDSSNNTIAEYAYNGTPEIEYADSYEMFTTTKSPQMVSEIACELQVLLSNKDVLKHFRTKGYCLEWKPHTHIINPAVYCNVYRPALAEQAVEALLSVSGFTWHKLSEGLEEKMDGIIQDAHGNKALVDVKFWYCSRMLKDNAEDKMQDTMLKTGIKNIIYINMFKINPKQKCIYKTFDGDETSFLTADFMEVPGIMDKHTFQPIHIAEISKFIARDI